MRFRFEMHQPREGGFVIARFRLWVTTSNHPLNVGLPAPVAEALKIPAEFRSKEQQAAIAAYWNENDPDLRKRRLAIGKLQLPLPIDPGIIQRRDAIAKAELPIKLDPKLVQLRQDVEQSKAQLANKRLTGVQDLAWALINNPTFLFNRQLNIASTSSQPKSLFLCCASPDNLAVIFAIPISVSPVVIYCASAVPRSWG